MTDRSRCTALHDDATFCQEPVTHDSIFGRRCTSHAEELRCTLRDPRSLFNIFIGRARTEAEIASMVRELPREN